MAILDKEGLKAFTIRNVAADLDVTPMALYHHVRNKAELATLVVEYANKDLPRSPPTGKWRDDLWELARWMRATRFAHPFLPHLLRMYHAWTEDVLHPTELWVSLWLESGLGPEAALIAARVSSSAITGMVDEEVFMQEAGIPDKSVLRALPKARLVFNLSLDRDMMFELGVRSIIDGVHARLKQDPQVAQMVKPKRKAKRKA